MTSTPKSDATPTYRGYRLQTLYALSRILEGNQAFHFQPEGKEDLAIFDQHYRLLEIA